MIKFKYSQYPNENMFSDLMERLRQYPDLDLERITEKVLWEKYKNNLANFVIRDNQIVGCGVIWHDLTSKNQDFVEVGNVWIRQDILPQDRLSILTELGVNIKKIARNKKLMAFCKTLKLARYFKKSPFFPFTKIANYQSCPQNLIESIPQFQGWFPEDIEKDSKYTRLLYLENRNIITHWYLIYE